jgi:membrane-bound lytic murein transglycosylase A
VKSSPARSHVIWALVVANCIAAAAVFWLGERGQPNPAGVARIAPVNFADLPGWKTAELRTALASFGRSCDILTKIPKDHPLWGEGYAGLAGDWDAACGAIPRGASGDAEARAYFVRWFTPLEVKSGSPALFTGYYEPLLAGSRTKSARFNVPIYGRPTDLISADLSLFRRLPAGLHIYGRVSGTQLVPYATRADIDKSGLNQAPVLLYVDDPVAAFFLNIQGSGRVRFEDGSVSRLSFAATNGRRYTSIGRVLIARGALERKSVSLQTIRDWLKAHPAEARSVMEEDQSFVFFALAPLGDPSLGSPGTEGVPLAAEVSVAIDSRVHPLGIPVFVSTTIPWSGPAMPGRTFNKLLIAQDTGGDIRGPTRGDIFFGAGSEAEAIAGRLKSHGRFFVLVPKPVAAALGSGKEISVEEP